MRYHELQKRVREALDSKPLSQKEAKQLIVKAHDRLWWWRLRDLIEDLLGTTRR